MPIDLCAIALEYGWQYERTLARRVDESIHTSPTAPASATGFDFSKQDDEEKTLKEKKVETPPFPPRPTSENPPRRELGTSWNFLSSWIWPTSTHRLDTTPLHALSFTSHSKEPYDDSYNDVDNVRANTLEFILGPEQYGAPFWWVSGSVGKRNE
jgi:hypothetical protein